MRYLKSFSVFPAVNFEKNPKVTRLRPLAGQALALAQTLDQQLAKDPQMGDYELQLVIAVNENRKDDIENLIAAGVNLNYRIANGFTPLGEALFSGNAELVRLLLDAGASPNTIAGPDRRLPIHMAVQKNRVDLLAMLFEAGAEDTVFPRFGGATVLMHAASNGNLPMVDMLLSRGCDINEEFGLGANVLEYARCLPEDVALWQRLLDAGADPHGSGWRTPLHHVAKGASGEIVKLLLAAGAEIDAFDYNGSTALVAAVLNGDLHVNGPEDDQRVEVVRVLVEAGVDVTRRDKDGKNALQHAIKVRCDRKEYHGRDCEASKKVIALIQAEFDRRKAAALSALPKHMPPELRALVLKLALLVEGTSEK